MGLVSMNEKFAKKVMIWVKIDLVYVPITPSCCGDSGDASPPPEPIDPDASESRSLKPRGLLRPPLLATEPISGSYKN